MSQSRKQSFSSHIRNINFEIKISNNKPIVSFKHLETIYQKGFQILLLPHDVINQISDKMNTWKTITLISQFKTQVNILENL